MKLRLLHPDEVLQRWPTLQALLIPAVEQGRGELEVTDIRRKVLGGGMFLFGGFSGDDPCFALTAEFVFYPRKTVLIVGFGAGDMGDSYDDCMEVLAAFARQGGAETIQTYCKNPAMVRYHKKHFGAEVAYTVLEKTL